MELREYIDAGIRKTQEPPKELAKHLGLAHASYIANARGGQCGLPNAACYKLAILIGVTRDRGAASRASYRKGRRAARFLAPFCRDGKTCPSVDDCNHCHSECLFAGHRE